MHLISHTYKRQTLHLPCAHSLLQVLEHVRVETEEAGHIAKDKLYCIICYHRLVMSIICRAHCLTEVFVQQSEALHKSIHNGRILS